MEALQNTPQSTHLLLAGWLLQTRFVDNNDGMTQGFFQEFRIFPGMETTTAKSEQDEVH